MKMLAGRAHGINDVAADELYNYAVKVRTPNWQLGGPLRSRDRERETDERAGSHD